MPKRIIKYTVIWAEGMQQIVNTKSEALKIAASLLGYYGQVTIKKQTI